MQIQIEKLIWFIDDQLLAIPKALSIRVFILSNQLQLQHSADNERNIRMYTDIQRRGPKAFQELILILIQSRNYKAVNILDPTIEIEKLQVKPPLTSRER